MYSMLWEQCMLLFFSLESLMLLQFNQLFPLKGLFHTEKEQPECIQHYPSPLLRYVKKLKFIIGHTIRLPIMLICILSLRFQSNSRMCLFKHSYMDQYSILSAHLIGLQQSFCGTYTLCISPYCTSLSSA